MKNKSGRGLTSLLATAITIGALTGGCKETSYQQNVLSQIRASQQLPSKDREDILAIYQHPGRLYKHLSASEKQELQDFCSNPKYRPDLERYKAEFPWMDINNPNTSDKELILLIHAASYKRN
jgi:hypothetical protein